MLCPNCRERADALFQCESVPACCERCMAAADTGHYTFVQVSIENCCGPDIAKITQAATDCAREVNAKYDALIGHLQRQRRDFLWLIECARRNYIDELIRQQLLSLFSEPDEPAIYLSRDSVQVPQADFDEVLVGIVGNRVLHFDVDRRVFDYETRLQVRELPSFGSYLNWDLRLFYAGGEASRACYLFEMATGALLHTTTMSGQRNSHAITKYSENLYIFGGFKDKTPTSLVEVYNLRTQTVSVVGNMKHARTNLAAVLCGDLIYIAGYALRGVGIKNEIEVFDPRTHRFSVIWKSGLDVNCGMVGFVRGEEVVFLKSSEVVTFIPGGEITAANFSQSMKKMSIKAVTKPVMHRNVVYFLSRAEGVGTVFAFDLEEFVMSKVTALRS